MVKAYLRVAYKTIINITVNLFRLLILIIYGTLQSEITCSSNFITYNPKITVVNMPDNCIYKGHKLNKNFKSILQRRIPLGLIAFYKE